MLILRHTLPKFSMGTHNNKLPNLSICILNPMLYSLRMATLSNIPYNLRMGMLRNMLPNVQMHMLRNNRCSNTTASHDHTQSTTTTILACHSNMLCQRFLQRWTTASAKFTLIVSGKSKKHSA